MGECKNFCVFWLQTDRKTDRKTDSKADRRLLRDGVDDRNPYWMTVCFRRIGVARQRIRVRHAGEGGGTIILYGGRLRDGGGDGDPLGVGAPAGVAVRATTVTRVAITADTAAVW